VVDTVVVDLNFVWQFSPHREMDTAARSTSIATLRGTTAVTKSAQVLLFSVIFEQRKGKGSKRSDNAY
jgi:hypothetical protein